MPASWLAHGKASYPPPCTVGQMCKTTQLPACRSAISTMVQVLEHENGDHSEVFVETADRAGLLTTIVQTLKDLNVNVVAAEVSCCKVAMMS